MLGTGGSAPYRALQKLGMDLLGLKLEMSNAKVEVKEEAVNSTAL